MDECSRRAMTAFSGGKFNIFYKKGSYSLHAARTIQLQAFVAADNGAVRADAHAAGQQETSCIALIPPRQVMVADFVFGVQADWSWRRLSSRRAPHTAAGMKRALSENKCTFRAIEAPARETLPLLLSSAHLSVSSSLTPRGCALKRTHNKSEGQICGTICISRSKVPVSH